MDDVYCQGLTWFCCGNKNRIQSLNSVKYMKRKMWLGCGKCFSLLSCLYPSCEFPLLYIVYEIVSTPVLCRILFFIHLLFILILNVAYRHECTDILSVFMHWICAALKNKSTEIINIGVCI